MLTEKIHLIHFSVLFLQYFIYCKYNTTIYSIPIKGFAFFNPILFIYIASVKIKVVSKRFTETLGVSFSLAALLDCIRRHHRHSINLISGAVSAA